VIITIRTGKPISGVCLERIRTGQNRSPTLNILTTLTDCFRVLLTFFEDRRG
jgi:hypothetical protein